ncbi:tetratricopeptide repeat protein [Halobacteriovorax sp. GB3]|uniref:tetratricopeptide repeat protein n=1 Tax=Halobacteriovorax sp. GB3 TaxID=2719615 RepID=UPI00235F297A|nr:tetratricopeptide repeat protein [Halobacteriovorax sp. GB3]MDD0853253.1 tetratricopeptide repeat protein [Halobacteriovorax sp. GB3]
MNATTGTTGGTLEGELQQTELGSFVSKNKGFVVGLIVLAIVAIFGYGIFSIQKNKSDEVKADKVAAFTTTFAKNYTDKKIDAAQLSKAYQELVSEVGSFVGLTPVTISLSDQLVKNNEKEMALSFLEKLNDVSSSTARFFIDTRLAALYEDMGKVDMAIASLEKVNQGGLKLLEEKIYLDLGRLYMAKGDKEKARASFDYIKKNLAQDEYKKLADIYLSKLK